MTHVQKIRNTPSLQPTNIPVHSDGVYVCALRYVDDLVDHLGPSHLVTLINQDTMIDTPDAVAPHKHLKLAMNDITEPTSGLVLPGEHHVNCLLEFAEGWVQDAPLLIHCWAGISRSTAAAYITMCYLNPSASEQAIAIEMRSLSPTSYPNRKLVEIADRLLDRKGRMTAAIAAIGRGTLATEGNIFGMRSKIPNE